MLMPMPREPGWEIWELPRPKDIDPWRFVLIPAQEDAGVGEYSLLDPHIADGPALPNAGLLSPVHFQLPQSTAVDMPGDQGKSPAALGAPDAVNAGDTRGLMETFGFTAPGSAGSFTNSYRQQPATEATDPSSYLSPAVSLEELKEMLRLKLKC